MTIAAFALADGAWIFLAFIVIAFFGLVYGYFTETGSGIGTRPYGKIYSGAPGAGRRGNAAGRDERVHMSEWSRGTR